MYSHFWPKTMTYKSIPIYILISFVGAVFQRIKFPSSGFTQVCVGHSLVKHGELLSMIRDFISLEVSHISGWAITSIYDPVNHGFCDLRSSISPCEFPPWVSQSPTISTIFFYILLMIARLRGSLCGVGAQNFSASGRR